MKYHSITKEKKSNNNMVANMVANVLARYILKKLLTDSLCNAEILNMAYNDHYIACIRFNIRTALYVYIVK